MTGKAIMLQGTGSDVGKSIIAAAFCRIFNDDGYVVIPFKAQNMALNSAVTPDGGEIGRAQALQADAARQQYNVDMNPILLKPKADNISQVIVRGRPYKDMDAQEYYRFVGNEAREIVKNTITELKEKTDLLVMEGAGSPAEINLHDVDIVNMQAAMLADAPVLLVADIDRGGVFASIVGTLELLPQDERDRIAGFIINKFRGDLEILKPGLDYLEERTGKPVLGVLPYFTNLRLPEEDSLSESRRENYLQNNNLLDIVVVSLPRISNFTDFDIFLNESGVSLRYVRYPEEMGNPDFIILPGTKNTVDDLFYLKESGLAALIVELSNHGVPVAGICGGYQMMGRMLLDPNGTESDKGDLEGLGLLDCETVFLDGKTTHQVNAAITAAGGVFDSLNGGMVSGYEIHSGITTLGTAAREFARICSRSGSSVDVSDGAVSRDRLVFGTYMHGIFDNHGFTRALLDYIAANRINKIPLDIENIERSGMLHGDDAINGLARIVRDNLDMDKIYTILGRDSK